MANCALNPIVYGTLNKEFGQVFRSFFTHLKCQQGPSSDTRTEQPSVLIDKEMDSTGFTKAKSFSPLGKPFYSNAPFEERRSREMEDPL
jgi:hypothetical protein